MDALNALGLAYEDSDDEEEPASQPAPAPAPPPASAMSLPAVSLPPIAAALPDAGALGLPDEEDWEGHEAAEDEDQPVTDRVGTKYNAVAVPTSIVKASDEHNYKATRGPQTHRNAGAAVKEALASVNSVPAAASSSSSSTERSKPPPARRTSAGGALLPPQLSGRRNVTTEELSNMRTAKRHKPAE